MNKFEILGRVNWIEIKYSEKGSCFTKILLAKKLPKKDEYESFPITFFNTKNGETAERLAETVKEGDYIRVTGKLGINRYIPKGQTRVKEDGAVENGNIAIIDFEGFKDEVPFDGGKAENCELEIGSNKFIPGFEEQLVGMKNGEEKDINLEFPKDYPVEELKGAPVVLKLK